MIDRETLIDAIERSDSILPEIPGHNEYVKFPGVLLGVTPTNDPNANKAMNARLSPEDVDTAIVRVKEFFAGQGKTFSWIVGPNTTPPDLGRRLQVHGFELTQGVDGLYLPDFNRRIEINEAVRIVELPLDGLEPAVPIGAVGFGSSEEDSRQFHRMITLSAPSVITRTYAAYLPGVPEPVASAYVTYFPDRPIALLCGGATLPEYRMRGVYRTLLAHRVAEIRRAGVEAAIVLADQTTSSPICMGNGFAKLCELQFYVCKPR
jgi:hypothetical protein